MNESVHVSFTAVGLSHTNWVRMNIGKFIWLEKTEAVLLPEVPGLLSAKTKSDVCLVP